MVKYLRAVKDNAAGISVNWSKKIAVKQDCPD
jgi:hypothetical protein